MPRRNRRRICRTRPPLEPVQRERSPDAMARALVRAGVASSAILGRGPGRADREPDTGDDIEGTP